MNRFALVLAVALVTSLSYGLSLQTIPNEAASPEVKRISQTNFALLENEINTSTNLSVGTALVTTVSNKVVVLNTAFSALSNNIATSYKTNLAIIVPGGTTNYLSITNGTIRIVY